MTWLIFQTVSSEPILLQMRHVADPRDLAADYKTVMVRQASIHEQQFAGEYQHDSILLSKDPSGQLHLLVDPPIHLRSLGSGAKIGL